MAALGARPDAPDPTTLNSTDSEWVKDIINQIGNRKNEDNPSPNSTKSIYPTVNRLSTSPAYRPDGTQPEIPKNLRQITTKYTPSNVESIKSSLSQIFEGRSHPTQKIAAIHIPINLRAIVDPSETSEHEYKTLGTLQSTTDIITESYPHAARCLLDLGKARVAQVTSDQADLADTARTLSGQLDDAGAAEEGTDKYKKKTNATIAKPATRGAAKQDRERIKHATDTAKKARQNSQGARTPDDIAAAAAGENAGSLDSALSPAAMEAFNQTHCGKALTEEKIRARMTGMTIEEQDNATCEIVAEAMLASANFEPGAMPELYQQRGEQRFELALQIMMSALISIQESDYLATEDHTRRSEPGKILIRRIESMKYSDPIRMMGAGIQIQAAYNLIAYMLEAGFKDNTTDAVVEALSTSRKKIPADGSAWGEVLGINEYGRGFATIVESEIKGSINSGSIAAYLDLMRELTPEQSESSVDYLTRFKTLVYDELDKYRKTSAIANKTVDRIMTGGSFNMALIAAGQIRKQAGISVEESNVASTTMQEQLNQQSIGKPNKDLTGQLDDFLVLQERIMAAHSIHVHLNNVMIRTRTKKDKKQRPSSTLREFAANICNVTDIVEEDTDEPAKTAEELVIERMDKMQETINALTSTKKSGTATTSKGNLSRLQAKYQHVKDRGYTQPAGADPDKPCNYCGEGGHEHDDCAKKGWDVFHDCRNAHASEACLKYLASKGWYANRPAPGTYPPFPQKEIKSSTKHSPDKSSWGATDDQAATIHDLAIKLEKTQELMKQQAEAIKKMNLKTETQSDDLDLDALAAAVTKSMNEQHANE